PLVRFTFSLGFIYHGGGNVTLIALHGFFLLCFHLNWFLGCSEKVKIPADKQFIFLEGEEREHTVIEWGAHAGAGVVVCPAATTTGDSATFTVHANNFTARWISFKNTFQHEDIWTRQAVVALVAGDRSSFYGCAFLGFQDTLSDLFRRHYFRDCYIGGAIDFIFGCAQSIYEVHISINIYRSTEMHVVHVEEYGAGICDGVGQSSTR
ncbi:hypothetical protein Taro_037862, partial [Colocasia esculenta]|nr:hypothetical protein [Colocasia esculenta]